jgi:hypothetical protein
MTTHKIKGFEVPFLPSRRVFANQWTEYEPNKRVLLPKGWRQGFSRLPLREAIVWDKDVPVEMRDGKILRVDIFRSASREHERLPALVPWSPYGKTGTGLLQTKEYAYVGVPPTDRVDWKSSRRQIRQTGLLVDMPSSRPMPGALSILRVICSNLALRFVTCSVHQEKSSS